MKPSRRRKSHLQSNENHPIHRVIVGLPHSIHVKQLLLTYEIIEYAQLGLFLTINKTFCDQNSFTRTSFRLSDYSLQRVAVAVYSYKCCVLVLFFFRFDRMAFNKLKSRQHALYRRAFQTLDRPSHILQSRVLINNSSVY